MPTDLPSPEEIMEELADRAIAQIDRRAPVAFTGALGEMLRYHAFLLAMHAVEEDDAPLSYAEVSGDDWHQPHQKWTWQYRRIFDRAAERIPDEKNFIGELAYIPYRLLQPEDGIRLSPVVTEAILNLQPMLMHSIEAWITRRSITEGAGSVGATRTGLSGSDARALSETMPGVLGAWEGTVELVPYLYDWRSEEAPDAHRWSRYAAAWPFLRQHLANTAYSLAVAVWNGDKLGARFFRQSLTRWPHSALMDVPHDIMDPIPWLHYPDLLDGEWEEAAARASRPDFALARAGTADGLFAEIVTNAKTDMCVVTAAILTQWSLGETPGRELAAQTARDLVAGTGDEDEDARPGFDFPSLLRTVIRLNIAGDRVVRTPYGAWVDEQIAAIDRIREGPAIPGRVLPVRTMLDRDHLRLGLVAALAAFAPRRGESGLSHELGAIASNDSLLPDGDNSLRGLLRALERFRELLGQENPALFNAISALAPNDHPQAAMIALLKIIEDTRAVIEEKRELTLAGRTIDPGALDDIRAAAEAAFMDASNIPYFDDVETALAAEGEEGMVRLHRVPKAALLRPPMDDSGSSWIKHRAGQFRDATARRAITRFMARPRTEAVLDSPLDTPEFWKAIVTLAAGLQNPVFVGSYSETWERLLRLVRDRDGPLAPLHIEHRRPDRDRGRFIANIEGIDIFAGDVDRGTGLLFSAHHLRRIGYALVPGGRVSIDFVPDEEAEGLTGTLELGYRQALEWDESPIFEIHMPVAGEGGEPGADG